MVVEADAACAECGGKLPLTGVPGPAPTKGTITPQVQYKSEGTTLVLATLCGLVAVCGIGQIYVGRIGRGITMLVVSLMFVGLVLLVVASLVSLVFPLLVFVAVFAHFVFFVGTVFDARKVCREYNEAIAGTGRPPW